MLKKIQLLSLAVVTCVSTASFAQGTPPSSKNIAVLEPTLTVEPKRTFGMNLPNKLTLNQTSGQLAKSDPVEIEIIGNTNATLEVKSQNGALFDKTASFDKTVSIPYRLTLNLPGASGKTIDLSAATQTPKTETGISVPVPSSGTTTKLTVTAEVLSDNPPAGTYSDTVTLTLTDVL